MERREIEGKRRFGSVKAAIDMYGGRTLEGNSNSAAKKSQNESLEISSSSTTRELHMARGEISRFDDSKRVAESMKSQAESELATAKKKVRELTSRIEESNSKAKGHTLEGIVRRQRDEEELELAKRKLENHQYAEVMRELEIVKQDLSKLKLDMASVIEQKNRAEKEIEASRSRFWSYSSSADALKREIEEVNEEQVLVELAKIEAVKELEAIEEQRREEHTQFSTNMENKNKKMNELLSEIDQSRELETKLAITTCDVDMLQNELKVINDLEKKTVQGTESFRHPDVGSETMKEELEAAKKELASISDERFQFMTSIDLVRNELQHVLDEIDRFRKSEAKTDAKLQSLGNKLLIAKAKLQAMTAAEETGKLTISNLSLTLDQMKTEAEVARKENELICEETAKFQAEARQIESETDLAERKLHDMIQELEAVKSSESVALEKLKSLSESAMRNRAVSFHQNTTITISRFEYEYLTGSASAAEEIADKKVAAAQAWVEALKESEKEILMKVDFALRKKRETRVEEARGTREAESTLPTKKVVVEEDTGRNKKGTESKFDGQNLQVESELPRKSVKGNGNMTPARRARYRKSMSPATRHGSRSSLTVVRRKKAMPTLVKLLNGKNIERDT